MKQFIIYLAIVVTLTVTVAFNSQHIASKNLQRAEERKAYAIAKQCTFLKDPEAYSLGAVIYNDGEIQANVANQLHISDDGMLGLCIIDDTGSQRLYLYKNADGWTNKSTSDVEYGTATLELENGDDYTFGGPTIVVMEMVQNTAYTMPFAAGLAQPIIVSGASTVDSRGLNSLDVMATLPPLEPPKK